MRKLILLFFLMISVSLTYGQSLIGNWVSQEDDGKTVIEFTQKGIYRLMIENEPVTEIASNLGEISYLVQKSPGEFLNVMLFMNLDNMRTHTETLKAKFRDEDTLILLIQTGEEKNEVVFKRKG